MSEPVKMPTRIDDPHQFLLWSADELIPMLVMLCFGIVLENVMIFLFLGWLFMRAYRRYKNSRPDGFLLHIFYWAGFIPEKAKALINPFKRKWIP